MVDERTQRDLTALLRPHSCQEAEEAEHTTLLCIQCPPPAPGLGGRHPTLGFSALNLRGCLTGRERGERGQEQESW